MNYDSSFLWPFIRCDYKVYFLLFCRVLIFWSSLDGSKNCFWMNFDRNSNFLSWKLSFCPHFIKILFRGVRQNKLSILFWLFSSMIFLFCLTEKKKTSHIVSLLLRKLYKIIKINQFCVSRRLFFCFCKYCHYCERLS